jgi:hypothetical protein
MTAQLAAGSRRAGRGVAALMAAIGLLIAAEPGHAQATADLQSLIRETQKMSRKRLDGPSQDLTMVWWVPTQFWERSMRDDPATTQQTVDRFTSTLEPYTLVIVMSGQLRPFGGMTFKSADAVRASVTIRDAQDVSYSPLPDAAISADAKNLLAVVRPIVANMLGPMGQNFNCLLFKSKTKAGRPLADPLSEGLLTVVVAGEEFRFRLPLGSLLPAKYDPATHDEFPGNYLYSPFNGTKLVNGPPLEPKRAPADGSAIPQAH